MNALQWSYLIAGIISALLFIIVRTAYYKSTLELLPDPYERDLAFMKYVVDIVGGTLLVAFFGPLFIATGVFTLAVLFVFSPIIILIIVLTS